MDAEVPEMVDMVVKAARAQGNETRGPERSEERHEQRGRETLPSTEEETRKGLSSRASANREA